MGVGKESRLQEDAQKGGCRRHWAVNLGKPVNNEAGRNRKKEDWTKAILSQRIKIFGGQTPPEGNDGPVQGWMAFALRCEWPTAGYALRRKSRGTFYFIPKKTSKPLSDPLRTQDCIAFVPNHGRAWRSDKQGDRSDQPGAKTKPDGFLRMAWLDLTFSCQHKMNQTRMTAHDFDYTLGSPVLAQ